MGTNYYFRSKNAKFVHKYFSRELYEGMYTDEEYTLEEYPDLHFKIHLNKCSCGWKPLFQDHTAFKSFAALESFYNKHKRYLEIYDEYGDKFTFDEYKAMMIEHASAKKTPCKWAYNEESDWADVVDCEPEEAELYAPFDHLEYNQTEKVAARKFHIRLSPYVSEEAYHRDPDYNFDWVDEVFV